MPGFDHAAVGIIRAPPVREIGCGHRNATSADIPALQVSYPDPTFGYLAAAAGYETIAYRIRSAKISTIPICPVIQHAGLTPIGPKA